MFERFTDKAKAVVHGAQLEAQGQGASSVRSEHVLAALLSGPENLAQAALLSGPENLAQAALLRDGIDLLALLRTVRTLDAAPAAGRGTDDAQALAVLGIDLDEVRRQVEDVFGPGALERTRAAQSGGSGSRPRWDRSAKKVLELSLREALRMRHNYIGTEHVLLGLLHPGTGAGQEVLAAAGVRLDSARTHVAELLRDRAAG